VFGFGKGFVIALVIAIIAGIGTKNINYGLAVIMVYAIVKIVWNILTD
jgi:hypothetical protein